MAFHVGRVTTEGDELYYEVRGDGPALLLIPGAGGDADRYAAVANILADEYKVITYDRRANARSTMHSPQNFEISQQSRDVVAVLHDAGEESAFIFGNSSGAVIALDLAKTQPQTVRAVVVHEPPLARLHPQSRKWQRFFARVYMTACRFGSTPAMLQFMLGIEVPVRQLIRASRADTQQTPSSEARISPQDSGEVLAKLELLPVTNYLPDPERIKQNGVKVFLAVGQWGIAKKAWYVEVSQLLADALGCELVTFPGHHGSYMDMPDTWAATLREVLHRAESAT
jgi:pimeloyl-ACP methyl ester carboxylesterase